MNPTESKSTKIIGAILATRLLGIFLILPVFSSYALQYPGSSHFLTGLAFGIYALTQALFQIPFGRASDRFGRKPVIVGGLMLFCAGSIGCGLAENIWQLIIARAVQGSGAVGAVAIAALGDFTRPEVRGQSFAITGLIIGASFMVSLLAGPVMASWMGFETLFYVLAALGVASITITLAFFPNEKTDVVHEPEEPAPTLRKNSKIKEILVSSFILSSILNIFLFVYPLSWESTAGERISHIWEAYFIMLLPAAFFAYPFLKIMERRKKMNIPPPVAIALLATGTAIAALIPGKTGLIVAGTIFFLGHSIFQPLLPAFLTQVVSSGSRGNVAGLLNLASFLGAFTGSMLAGLLFPAGFGLALALCFVLIAAWPLVGIPKPPSSGAV
ncbi:MAG: MFS transporter [Candidatus Mycalebacterium zealandia]|nr:MAG: MFS transporter [Candidatus Mycalebacterium zealandia]